MKNLILLGLLVLLASCGQEKKSDAATASEADIAVAVPDTAFFEIRTYYCHPDKLDDLLARFRNHTMALFEKHGMANLGYWVPQDNAENKLVYLMGYPDRASRDASWKAFGDDPEWKQVWEASRSDGPIVDSVVNRFYTYTDYSPEIKPEDLGPRIFSLRTYYTHPGRLSALHQRFADHTLELFTRNGMTNIAYLNLEAADPDADHVLTYLITFPDTAARTASWNAFRADPDWLAAREASEADGPIVESITDELLLPVDFSPLK